MTYNKSDQNYDRSEGFYACACMGPCYGEPFCPCEMSRRGLPMSVEHVEAIKEAKEILTEVFTEYFNKQDG